MRPTTRSGIVSAPYLCVLLFVLTPRPGAAQAVLEAAPQAATLTGVVTIGGTGLPLPGAHVVLAGTTFGVATRVDGTYRLAGVPAGRYTVEVRSLGFETARQSIDLQPRAIVELAFTLEEARIEMEEITITGGYRGLDGIPGSATYIGPRELAQFNYQDVNRVLQGVPGINIQEEDGYGLRPNIGLRGTGAERSSKITVMEDGVLIAPAPYAAPAAYYFPSIGRMQGVEVRKGSSQIQYGPYTTGGALNLISTQIPADFSGRLDVLAGEHDERTLHVNVGSSYRNAGFLLETYQAQSDGFKQLDGGGNTGFDKRDYLAKLRFNTRPDARIYQAVTFKAGRTTEASDETYLGLTDLDFAANPVRRYAGSQQDVMETEQSQLVVRHLIRPRTGVDVTTTLYRTDFARNWYKLDRVRAAAAGSRSTIASILDNPLDYAAEYAILTGQSSTHDQALEVKANNRTYYARGVQTVLGVQFETPGIGHDLHVGLRLHEDQIDRFQWVDFFRMHQGEMELTQAGLPGTESNRVETATAWAGFAQYQLAAGRLKATPGLRFEHITINRDDYGKADPGRTGAARASRSNTVSVWIPGLGLDYAFNEALSAFGGLHRGFSPPGSKEGTRPEKSINYELGLRYRAAGLRAEGVAFFNDYSNLLGADLAAAGGTGSSDAFNGGAVNALGLELMMSYDLGLLLRTRLSLPLTLAYTLTDATFQNTFESDFEGWGTVEEGDQLPYLPRHQLAVGAGWQHRTVDVNLRGRYVSRMRTVAGQGAFPEASSTDAHFTADLSASYALMPQVKLFGSVRNLMDAAYIVARRPAGVRPGLPRTLQLGVQTRF